MIKNIFSGSLLLLLALSCSKETKPITKENIKEVLTEYGKANPENEVIIKTRLGTIRLKLYDETPLHRSNFIKLIKENHYDEGEFYRVVNEFMIQGGDLQKQYAYTIPAEFTPHYFHKKGALAMARRDENNPAMESSATEFYIVHGGRYADWEIDDEAKNLGLTLSPEQRNIYLKLGGDMSLDQKYTVFGEVVEGLDVIDKIANAKVYGERPLQKISFEISVVEK